MTSWKFGSIRLLGDRLLPLGSLAVAFGPLLRSLNLAVLFVSMLGAVGCAAVYPEIATPVRPAPSGVEPQPAPPEELLYLAFKGAEIPKLTRDGRRWDELGMGAPDAFAIVYLGSKELMRTDVHKDSFHPSWPYTDKKNYRIPQGTSLKVELWDDNAMVNHPICSKEIDHPHEEASAGELRLECESGAWIAIELSPAKPKFGLGFSYELRSTSAFVRKVMPLSPAERAGLKRGEQIVRVMGLSVSGMSEGELKSQINANARSSLVLSLKDSKGKTRSVELSEGPIYSDSGEVHK